MARHLRERVRAQEEQPSGLAAPESKKKRPRSPRLRRCQLAVARWRGRGSSGSQGADQAFDRARRHGRLRPTPSLHHRQASIRARARGGHGQRRCRSTTTTPECMRRHDRTVESRPRGDANRNRGAGVAAREARRRRGRAEPHDGACGGDVEAVQGPRGEQPESREPRRRPVAARVRRGRARGDGTARRRWGFGEGDRREHVPVSGGTGW